MWQETYKPGATGSDGIYAGRSYWIATYDWSTDVNPLPMTYPYDTSLYSVALTSGFATGYTPTFAIIGFGNKVYYDTYTFDGFVTALNLAIDEYFRPIYVENPIPDKNFLSDFTENIDLNSVFTESEGNPMTFSITGNTNPDAVTATINGSILTIEGVPADIRESVITVKAESGENSVQDEFRVNTYNSSAFTKLEESFEALFPPPFWQIKYNTAADGGLNGTNLTDPLPGEETWFQNTTSTENYGSDYIYSGSNSALIKYWAPEFNWLISPPMELDFSDYDLKFWLWFNSSSYPTMFHVLVDDGLKGWTSILDYDGDTPDNEYNTEIILSMADYVGKTVRIAFVYEYSDGYELAIDDVRVESPSGIEAGNNIVEGFVLDQNYPNPFNPVTRISFSVSDNTDLKLSVYNSKGEFVETLLNGMVDSGEHCIDFDASDLTAGVYYYKIETANSSLSRKMVLVK